MAINTDIWGAPETWETPAGTMATNAAIKLPVFGNNATYKNTIAGAFDEGVFTWNDEIIDKSFSPWGIGKNGAFANPKWLYIAAEVGATYDAISVINIYTRPQLKDDANRPFMPVWRNASPANVTEMYSRFDYQYTPNAGAYSTYKNNQRTAPILSFKYNNIIVVPWIECTKIDNNQASGYSYQRYSVDDYFDNHQTEYPYITSVYIKGYYFGDRPDVQTARTNDTSDFNNNRSTICNYYSEEVAGYAASWEGNPTKYRLGSYNVTPYTYTVVCGKSPLSQTALLFSVARNQEYKSDDKAFARWTYQSTTYAHGIRGDMFDFEYKYNNGTAYITPRWAGATKADVLREVAYLGFWFTCDTTKAQNAAIGRYCTDDDVYMPVFDSNGVTTGEYKSGTDAAAIAPADDATPADFIDYDPNAGGGDIPETDTGDLSNVGAPRAPIVFNSITFYAMSGLDFWNFVQKLNSYYLGKTSEDWTLDFQGVNPAEYILQCYYTYFDLPVNDSDVNVNIGAITLPDIVARKLSEGDTMERPNKWQYCDFGVRFVEPLYNDFRDFAPYTTIELYLPLAGTIDLETAYVMGHNISIRYYYSVLTMTGVACVYRDNMLYKTVDLQIASQIPLLSTNIGQYQNQIVSLENARKQNAMRLTAGAITTAIGAGATIATGGAALPALLAIGTGAAALATGAEKLDELSYQIEHTAPSLSTTGAAEATNSLCCGQLKPKMIIKRALMLPRDDDVYAATVGNACSFNTTISEMSGLIVCSNADLSGIPATAAEISAIQSLLTGGIYV